MKQRGTIMLSDSVLSILFILVISSAVLIGAKYYFDMSKAQRAKADTSTIAAAIVQYEMEIGEYPDSLQELTKEKGQYGPWLKDVPTDIFSNKQSYQYLKDKNTYMVYSVGADGISSSNLASGIGGDDIGYSDN